MQIQLAPNFNFHKVGKAYGAAAALSNESNSPLPTDSVTLSAEAVNARKSGMGAGLRKAGMYLALGLALTIGFGAAGSAHAAESTNAPVAISQTVGNQGSSTNVVVVEASSVRHAGRAVHEIGMAGKEVGQKIGQTGKKVGQEVGKAGKKFGLKVGSVAKDFWAGVTGK